MRIRHGVILGTKLRATHPWIESDQNTKHTRSIILLEITITIPTDVTCISLKDW